MSGNLENKRELSEEETNMVTGGTEPEPMEETYGKPGISDDIEPAYKPETHLYKCSHCDYRLTTDSIFKYPSCPNCHQNASWYDLGGATPVFGL